MSKGKMIAIGVLVLVAGVIVYLMFSEGTAATEEDKLTDNDNTPTKTPDRTPPVQITEFSNVGVRTDRFGNEITEFSQYGSDGKVIAIYVLRADKTGYDIKK